MTSTGHIQTIVNPPGKPGARSCAGPKPAPNPQARMRAADKHEGSWWPH